MGDPSYLFGCIFQDAFGLGIGALGKFATLTKDALVNLGLSAAVEDLAQKIYASDTLKVSAHVFDIDEIVLSNQMTLRVYRIIQKFAQNVIKHAHPSHMAIQLSQEDVN